MKAATRTRKKQQQPIFDTIHMVDKLKTGDGTVWQGDRGTYVIKHTDTGTPKRPVAHVMLNSKYFTGLFRTKHRGIFSGDIKTPAGKIYLLFVKHEHDGNIEIVQKNTPTSV